MWRLHLIRAGAGGCGGAGRVDGKFRRMRRFLLAYLLLWLMLWLLVATGRAKFFIALYDFWMGVFVDTKKHIVYVVPFPCVVFKVERR